MHPFLPISDLKFLTVKELSQVRLDPYSLQFHFLDGTTIAVNRRIEHVDEAGQTHVHDCQIQTGAALYLHQLLQRCIAMIEVEPYRLSLTSMEARSFESSAMTVPMNAAPLAQDLANHPA